MWKPAMCGQSKIAQGCPQQAAVATRMALRSNWQAYSAPCPCPLGAQARRTPRAASHVSFLRPVTDEGNTSSAPQALAESIQRRQTASRAENAQGIGATLLDGVPHNCYGLNRKLDAAEVLDAEQLASPI